MKNAANWRTESRTVYSNDFKLRMVELASRPDANVAQLAREHGVDNNLIFKWLRLWQREGRISRRMPATIVGPVASPVPGHKYIGAAVKEGEDHLIAYH